MAMWRIAPSLTSAIIVTLGSLFSFILLESQQQQIAGHLGYDGATLRVVAIPESGDFLPSTLTSAVIDFVAQRRLAVAYSRSYGTGIVTLFDEDGLFRNSESSLIEFLGSNGIDARAAIASELYSTLEEPGTLLPQGVELTGTYQSNTMFEERYPVILFNTEAQPFGEGVYLLAGDRLATDPRGTLEGVVETFGSTGMEVVDVALTSEASVSVVLARIMGTMYGVVVLMFAGIVLIAQLLVFSIHAALGRERLVILAVLGESKHGLRLRTVRNLLTLATAGIIVGCALSLMVVLGAMELSLAELTARFKAVAVAFAGTLTISLGMSAFVAQREARSVSRVVPC